VNTDISNLRNFGVVAHINAGKTTLSDRVVYRTGGYHRIGSVDDGDTYTDTDEEEKRRGITIKSAAVAGSWRNHRLNLIDTPGHTDFTAEVERSMRVIDGAVMVFCAVSGVQAQTEKVWRIADKHNVPRICFVNKMDRMGANFFQALEDIQSSFKVNAVAVQIPVGSEKGFVGIIDLVTMKQLEFNWTRESSEMKVGEIDTLLAELAQEMRQELIEKASECSDELLGYFVDGGDIPEEVVRSAIRRGTLERTLCPVFCGSAMNNIGVEPVLDALVDYLPSPLDVMPETGIHSKSGKVIEIEASEDKPFAGLIFKTETDKHGTLAYFRVYSGKIKTGDRMFNSSKKAQERANKIYKMSADNKEEVGEASAGDIIGIMGLRHSITGDTLCDQRFPVIMEDIEFSESVVDISIEPKVLSDLKELERVLGVMVIDDPTLKFRTDEETGQIILSGMGELHLEVVLHDIHRNHGMEVRSGKPTVVYRESVSGRGMSEFIFDGMIGDRRHRAGVQVAIEPTESFDFEIETDMDEAIPLRYVESMVESIKIARNSGPVGGYPLVSLSVKVKWTEFSNLSSEVALIRAAVQAFEDAVRQAGPVLLEPLMSLSLDVVDESVGNVISDLSGRRASIEKNEANSFGRRIEASCPVSELFGYVGRFRSLTQGKGEVSMSPSGYKMTST